ncbi:hypothetical protein HPT25_06080 [Bacillus sp. BRMEA1]|uniref:hypothetical protein n=1 Tax=Neobacillus endophyticus TaxID=2738405 RepID=UPI0015649F60|nr:hypothetical protein [Neobacillus endophyticus]NRD77064.1 hypothetical protein [Neobacillus endophyticus]
MAGLIIAIIILNFVAFRTNKRLSKNQIIHIWAFTTVFQDSFDLFVDYKYQGYWYFTKDVDWQAVPAHFAIVPPVNMMFLNWFPFNSALLKQILYFICWDIGTVTYEFITMLPEPWGYFHYGWWKWWYSAMINPMLLLILIGYYRWICQVEDDLLNGKKNK